MPVSEIPASAYGSLRRWAELWQVPGLEKTLVIEVSQRLSRRLALAYLNQGLIRLHVTLLEPQNEELLHEALCHEFAHLAVRRLYKRRTKPHGGEWQTLVRAAGYSPTRQLPVPPHADSPARKPRGLYEHSCPVCHMVRTAKRPMSNWRCADCVAAGLSGELVITRLSPVGA